MSATIYTCRSPAEFDEAVAQASKLLRNGKLVVVPTETVYGIAINLALRSAVQEAMELKHIKTPAPWVVHLPDAAATQRFLGKIPPVASRLMRKCWPGPVAFELPVAPEDRRKLTPLVGAATADEMTQGGMMAVRCPDNAVTHALLSRVKHPIAILGAGKSTAAHSADAIAKTISEAVAAIVDDGPTRYRKASTVVQVQQDKLKVVRPGVIDARIIYRMADLTILFVCSGNTCRSPMAAGFAREFLAKKLHTRPQDLADHHVLVLSAGTGAFSGMPATADAIAAAAELGADIEAHSSQPLTGELLRRADVIYTMTKGHLKEIIEMNPSVADKTFTLDENGDVSDPIGSSRENYRKVAQKIHALIAQRLDGIEL